MTMLSTALVLLATMALPPPPGAVRAEPLPAERVGKVKPMWLFDGFYRAPFALAETRLTGHLAGHGWRLEREVLIAEKQGRPIDKAYVYTNAQERLTAMLSREGARRTIVRYAVEPRVTPKSAEKGDAS